MLCTLVLPAVWMGSPFLNRRRCRLQFPAPRPPFKGYMRFLSPAERRRAEEESVSQGLVPHARLKAE